MNINNRYNSEYQEIIVTEFLQKVRKSLPFWLRENKNEVNDILKEIEDHIWDKAYELAQGDEPTQYHLQNVIAQMGTPKEITKEYKKSGTPKYFISEELFPWYWKILLGTGLVVLVINLITALVSIGSASGGSIISNFFLGTFLGIMISFTVATVAFVILSQQGFIPAKFRNLIHRNTSSQILKTKQVAGTHKLANTSIDKIDKAPVDIRYRITDRIDSFKMKEPKFYRRKDYLLTGTLGFIFGLILISLPSIALKPLIGNQINQDLIQWLLLVGGLLTIVSIIRLLQAMIGFHVKIQQIMLGIHSILVGLFVPIFINLYDNTRILEDTLRGIFPGFEADVALIIFSVFIFNFILAIIIMNVVRMVKFSLYQRKQSQMNE